VSSSQKNISAVTAGPMLIILRENFIVESSYSIAEKWRQLIENKAIAPKLDMDLIQELRD